MINLSAVSFPLKVGVVYAKQLSGDECLIKYGINNVQIKDMSVLQEIESTHTDS